MLDPQITAALDQVARRLGEARDLDEVLESITATARLSINEIDHAGISITHRDGSIETRAWTGSLVTDLDQIQYALGEGPCLDAMDPSVDQDVVHVDNIRQDQRWPTYVPRAVQCGLRSQLGVRIYAEEKTVGGLNLYSTTSDTISPESAALAQLFATQAALALGRVRRESDLVAALETRELIGKATGIVMARYQLNDKRAFEYLIRVSQTSNVKLRELARALVSEAPVGT